LRLFGYGENYRQAFADYYQIPEPQVPENPLDLLKSRTLKNEWAEKTKPHVLLIVMESFGAYWLKYDQAPFDLVGDLKSHLQQDTFITNFLSSTAATIGSLSCLMISAPQRPISEFLTESDYLQVPFRSSIARTYKEAGYKARFLYGGNPGWREINKFAHAQGFDTTEGEVDIGAHFNGKIEKHDWGIYDQDFFKYIEETLADAKQPELLLAMTTTNHPPYQLPSDYKVPELQAPQELSDRLTGDKALAAKRFQTYRYSTQKLAEFLTRVKASPLRDKLIIAVTGDHTFWIVNFTEQQALQKGSVPFYLYLPPAIQKKFPADMFGSHADIAPTLYNLSLSEKDYYSTGHDLFAVKSGYALNAGNIILNNQGGVLASSSADQDSFIDWEGHYERLIPGAATEEKKQLSKKYKSLMGVLDYYFMKEKKENHPHADSSR
jgi:phosphoglycerol transferase MdoB-like AlkP superfamily enzyme